MSNAMPSASSNGSDLKEKDFEKDYVNPNDTSGDGLRRIRTAGSISIPPDVFEKLYLSPENRVKGDLRKTFGNPTPL